MTLVEITTQSHTAHSCYTATLVWLGAALLTQSGTYMRVTWPSQCVCLLPRSADNQDGLHYLGLNTSAWLQGFSTTYPTGSTCHSVESIITHTPALNTWRLSATTLRHLVGCYADWKLLWFRSWHMSSSNSLLCGWQHPSEHWILWLQGVTGPASPF